MVNSQLVEQKEQNMQAVRTYLFKNCQQGIDAGGLADSEVGKRLGIDWQKAKRYLDQIEKENLLHAKKFGNTVAYFPNGKALEDTHPHKITLGAHIDLYLDNFPGPYGKPFMRLAQKRDGQMIGSVIIPLEKLSEFTDKFSHLSQELKKLKSKEN